MVQYVINKIVKEYHKNLETYVLKELSKKGYNFDSHEVRNMFAKNRLVIYQKGAGNWLYLDNDIFICSWRSYPEWDELKMGWVL
jgi:hypothetical protein